jgi:hypothetical protein
MNVFHQSFELPVCAQVQNHQFMQFVPFPCGLWADRWWSMYVNLLIIFYDRNILAFRTIMRDVTGFIVIRRAHHTADICNEDTCLRRLAFWSLKPILPFRSAFTIKIITIK